MKNKLILGTGSLLSGLVLFFLALRSDPSASADVINIDPMAVARFQVVLYGAIVLVIVSFVLFIMAAIQGKD